MNSLNARPGKLDVKALPGVVIISLVQDDGVISFNIGMDPERAMQLGWTIAQAAFASERGNSNSNGGIIVAKGDTNA